MARCQVSLYSFIYKTFILGLGIKNTTPQFSIFTQPTVRFSLILSSLFIYLILYNKNSFLVLNNNYHKENFGPYIIIRYFSNIHKILNKTLLEGVLKYITVLILNLPNEY